MLKSEKQFSADEFCDNKNRQGYHQYWYSHTGVIHVLCKASYLHWYGSSAVPFDTASHFCS